jgi:DNA-binding FadR family transcriptional regulator
MKIIQTTMQKTFVVKHGVKTYVVDFAGSDGQSLATFNRKAFEVFDEDGEELPASRRKLAGRLIRHVVSRFKDSDAVLLREAVA